MLHRTQQVFSAWQFKQLGYRVKATRKDGDSRVSQCHNSDEICIFVDLIGIVIAEMR